METSLTAVLKAIYSSPEVRWLVALLLANLFCGVVASIRQKDFSLTKLADWLGNRLAPLFAGYGVVSFLAWANPGDPWIDGLRATAVATLVLTMLGYIAVNLRDWGIAADDPPKSKPA